MFDLFYTLFKYKEKAQKDELGYYPEKVNVREGFYGLQDFW